MKKLRVLLVLFLFAGECGAELTVSIYRSNPNEPHAQMYILGLGAGFAIANAALRNRPQPPLYCPPAKLGLNLNNLVSVLN